MSREDTQKVRAWLVSKYVNIGSNEIDALLAELETRGMAAEPQVIDRILKRRFPEAFKEQSMSTTQNGRVVPPRRQEPAPQQSQTAAEIEAVMAAYIRTNHFQTLCPNSAPLWVEHNGQLYVGSRANLALLKSKLQEMGVLRIRVTDIQEAVNALALAGVFERLPQVQVVEKPVETPKPDARTIHNQQVKLEKSLQNRETSPIRGAKEAPKPLIPPKTNSIEEQTQSEKAAAENATIREAQRRISTYASHSHSKTYSHRAELQSVFTQAMNEGLEAEQVLARVDQAIDRLAGNSSIR